MTAGEMTAVLAQWKAQAEGNGRGWPADAELLELMVLGADLENSRLRKALYALFDQHFPGMRSSALVSRYVEAVEKILDAKEIR